VITGFFGMNFDAIPFIHEQWAFWAAVGVMGVAVSVLLYAFKRRGWL
jgi:magnesium transporter